MKIFMICVALWLSSCIDPYNTSGTSNNFNYLVVEAFYNATEKTCSVKLSRTIPLDETSIQYESGASVILQNDIGDQFTLTSQGEGEYKLDNLIVGEDAKLTLKITTVDGENYESDAVAVYKATSLDSITWNETPKGVTLDVNAHSDIANTGYYYWQFTETWAYRSAFASILVVVGDTVEYRDYNNPDEAIYECYMTKNSSSILIGSSKGLAQDIINNAPLTTIPWSSSKTLVKYSILVEQRVIDQQAYEYWKLLKKNTEELGTIFDPMPFLPLSNIRCVSSPDKLALGYFNASETTQKRIFIKGQDIDFPANNFPITGYEGCSIVVKLFGESFDGYMPTSFETVTIGGQSIDIGYQVARPKCVDCRLMGGTNIKPVFWEQ